MKCEHTANCPDHTGKFTDCLAEAVYEMSLDHYGYGYVESTGSTEFEGHYALMEYPEDWAFALDLDRTVQIPAGHYIVATESGGAVHLLTFDTEEDARKYFDGERRSYENWAGVEEY